MRGDEYAGLCAGTPTKLADNPFKSYIVGGDDTTEVALTLPLELTDAGLEHFRPIGYSFNGQWFQFEKPGELVALPLPHLPTR